MSPATPPLAALRLPTLLEAGLLMAVLLVVWVGSMVAFSRLHTERGYSLTLQRQQRAEDALITHVLAFGHLPAPLTETPRAVGAVLVGQLPVARLGLTSADAQDGWGRPMEYWVLRAAIQPHPSLANEPSTLRVRAFNRSEAPVPAVALVRSAGADGATAPFATAATITMPWRDTAPTDMAEAAQLDDALRVLTLERWQQARRYLEALP